MYAIRSYYAQQGGVWKAERTGVRVADGITLDPIANHVCTDRPVPQPEAEPSGSLVSTSADHGVL